MSSKSRRRRREPGEQAFHDQLAAAANGLGRLTDLEVEIARAIGWFITDPRPGPLKTVRLVMPEWVRQGLRDTFEPWMRGQSRTCVHKPDFWHPQPVFACAWKPGLVVCAQCTYLIAADTVTEDRTCDHCGRVVDPDNGDGIYVLDMSDESMRYRAGVCHDCCPEELRYAGAQHK